MLNFFFWHSHYCVMLVSFLQYSYSGFEYKMILEKKCVKL